MRFRNIQKYHEVASKGGGELFYMGMIILLKLLNAVKNTFSGALFQVNFEGKFSG